MRQVTVAAERKALRKWLAELPAPWYGAMEATIFTGWVYDFLKPYAVEPKVAESAGKEQRGPISKKRNKHLQTKLIEAAKIAPHWNEHLALLHDRELARGNRNRATLVVVRKLVEFMLAVDWRKADFELLKEAA